LKSWREEKHQFLTFLGACPDDCAGLDRKNPILLQGLHPMTLQNKDKEKCDRIAALESKVVET